MKWSVELWKYNSVVLVEFLRGWSQGCCFGMLPGMVLTDLYPSIDWLFLHCYCIDWGTVSHIETETKWPLLSRHFQMHFLEWKWWEFLFKFHWNLFPEVFHNKPALVQVMAWCQTGEKPLPEPMMTQFAEAYVALEGDELTWERQTYETFIMRNST